MARKKQTLAEQRLTVRFVTHDVTLADEFQDHAQTVLGGLQRIYPNMQDAEVEVRRERGLFVAEVTLKIARYLLRGQEKASSVRAAFDQAMGKIDRQLHRYKKRLIDRRRRAKSFVALAAEGRVAKTPPPALSVVRIKRFPVKPMTIDEATMQMDLLGHDFFAFVNAATGRVNILYRRRAGGLGLLEPGEDEEE